MSLFEAARAAENLSIRTDRPEKLWAEHFDRCWSGNVWSCMWCRQEDFLGVFRRVYSLMRGYFQCFWSAPFLFSCSDILSIWRCSTRNHCFEYNCHSCGCRNKHESLCYKTFKGIRFDKDSEISHLVMDLRFYGTVLSRLYWVGKTLHLLDKSAILYFICNYPRLEL